MGNALRQVLVEEALRVLVVGRRILGINLGHQDVQGRLLEAHFICIPSISRAALLVVVLQREPRIYCHAEGEGEEHVSKEQWLCDQT